MYDNPSFVLRFVAEGQMREVHVSADGLAWPVADVRLLGATLVHGEGTWRMVAEPTAPVRVLSLEAFVPVDLKFADALYLNGYNCWTDSVERQPGGIMRGLEGVPRRVIDEWVLDGSGDYRFTDYDLRPGYQHGFSYAYLRYGNQVDLVASLNENSGFTTIYERRASKLLKLSKEPPAHELAAGETCELMSFCRFEGKLTECVERWFAAAGISRRECPPLVGYSSWYRHYGDISEGKLLHDLEGVAAEYAGRDLGPARAVFQVDDGYAKVGDWLECDTERFGLGMAHIASKAEEAGLVPGIWLAPFVAETESRTYAEHPEWLLRDASGEPVAMGSNWSRGYALDTLNPEVRAYVREVIGVITKMWGYKLLKTDFIFAACMLPHGGMNRGQLMADAIDLLRDAAAPGTWFDLCGVPMASAFGKAEYCRVGCDVSLKWDDEAYMRPLHRERISSKRSLANTWGRAHLDGLAFRNDPDVFFLRESDDLTLSAAQKAALLEADSACGGVFFTSDDMAEWGAEQRAQFEAALSTFLAKEA